MIAQPYIQLSDLTLLALCCYREARGESFDGKRAVCHVIKNRTLKPSWWGHDWQSVILKPFQFSSFNPDDINNEVWPKDESPAWAECMAAASAIHSGMDEDLTEGATYYYDTSIQWPKAWGSPSCYANTLNIGRLRFYKLL